MKSLESILIQLLEAVGLLFLILAIFLGILKLLVWLIVPADER